MSASTISAPPKYIAEVRNSQEVTLYGTADLACWKKKLLPQKLVPIEQNGQARLLISAVASTWLGVGFREFLIAIEANPESHSPEAGSSPGMYLLTAYNTSRAFAFMEQRYFQTPYTYGGVEIQCGQPTSFRLKQRTGELVTAERTPLRSVAPRIDEAWEGAIYLPPRTAKGPPHRQSVLRQAERPHRDHPLRTRSRHPPHHPRTERPSPQLVAGVGVCGQRVACPQLGDARAIEDLSARLIHGESCRRGGPDVALNVWVAEQQEVTEVQPAFYPSYSFVTQSSKAMPGPPREGLCLFI